MKNIKTRKRVGAGRNFNPEGNTINLYMRELSNIPLLKKEEEERLARLAVQGDVPSKEKLIKANLRFVISIAYKYQGQGLPLEDLISEGNLGLLTAMKRFDIDKGYRFITYAVWWIRQSITKAINDKGRMIRLPLSMKSGLSQLEKTKNAISAEPSANENNEIVKIARLLGLPVVKVRRLMQIRQEVLSLEDPVYTKLGTSMIRKDIIVDERNRSTVEAMERDELKKELNRIIDGLGKRPAEIIRCRYGLDNSGFKTLKELSDHFNLSRERVRQIERRAIWKIQQSPRIALLKSYIA